VKTVQIESSKWSNSLLRCEDEMRVEIELNIDQSASASSSSWPSSALRGCASCGTQGVVAPLGESRRSLFVTRVGPETLSAGSDLL
jgi:hypothetical protein